MFENKNKAPEALTRQDQAKPETTTPVPRSTRKEDSRRQRESGISRSLHAEGKFVGSGLVAPRRQCCKVTPMQRKQRKGDLLTYDHPTHKSHPSSVSLLNRSPLQPSPTWNLSVSRLQNIDPGTQENARFQA
ncbi:hypothetical protein NDU88_003607 [Pleurodeles waltl]|uniref:Uncharacterized protein n=1 Tax=Pleurodeles waltl TaxID=8319 RepID=A0AAV7RFS5_PLEWA|nr:hypothetical protein NDU88_003607 [Pleurodeles waltl]